jgi:hypothetical protein
MAKITRNNNGSVKLSPNFHLSEFIDSDHAERNGIENIPDPLAIQSLFKLAELLEQVRKLLGDKVISVSSGFRSVELNKAIGGSRTSDHMRGEAADFVCRGFGTAAQVAAAIAKSDINFGQLIFEGTWVHISLPNRAKNREVLTAKFVKGEKTRYLPGIVT